MSLPPTIRRLARNDIDEALGKAAAEDSVYQEPGQRKDWDEPELHRYRLILHRIDFVDIQGAAILEPRRHCRMRAQAEM